MSCEREDLLDLAARLTRAAEERASQPAAATISPKGLSPVPESGDIGDRGSESPVTTPSEASPLSAEKRGQAGTEPGTASTLDPLAAVADLDHWPEDCLASARRFRHPDALLYPLLGGRVRTPQGVGLLRQVLGGRAVVEFEGADKAVRFRIDEVWPLDMWTGGVER